ncbi:MAG: hypothetical protein CME06_17725 [Gemmatimonadetes bacterium]|nr:hypothetical protein [Gemmatimonadota bacterium]
MVFHRAFQESVMLTMVLGVALSCAQAIGQEHPEHPSKGEHAEHPEHPDKGEHPESAHKAPTIEEVAKFLENHVTRAAAGSDGAIHIMDKKAGVKRNLKLDKIHRERLAKTGEGVYFVCADFKDDAGKVFDLDFWVKRSGEGLKVADTMIHKEAGKARYSWSEKGGVWSRTSVD